MPDFDHEDSLRRDIQRDGLIAGVDEAGRGPWAGPVVAAAVCFGAETPPDGLDDSKKLTEAKRENLEERIRQCAHVGVGMASVNEIDTHNILHATLLAMTRAVDALSVKPIGVLVDGNKAPDLGYPTRTLVKGDGKSLSIAAASIIAKVTRDRIMVDLARAFPEYAWEANKGYGTAAHRAALTQAGVTQHHRRSFAPIHKILSQDSALTI